MSDKLDEKALERVARALYEAMEGPFANQDFSRQCRQWDSAKALAAIAIEALGPGSTGAAEGWVLVPKEPTKEMLAAALARPPLGIPFDAAESIKADYRAMLSAAGESEG